MKTILVTGGCGFIGSNFLRLVMDETDYFVINLDKLTYAGNLDSLKDVESNPNYIFIQADICDKEAVAKALEGVDVVFHFAAESHVDRSIAGPEVFTTTNVLGTHILLEEARKAGVKKFIHISTDEVYGSISKGSFKESDMLVPSSPYSASKAAAEMIVLSYYKTYSLPVIITRSSNNFGPYQYPEKLIPKAVKYLSLGKKIPIHGDGSNRRNWLHAEDTAQALVTIIEKGKLHHIYNVSGTNELENRKVIELVLRKYFGRAVPLKKHAELQYVRQGEDVRYSIDDSEVRALGWKNKKKFEKEIGAIVRYYKNKVVW